MSEQKLQATIIKYLTAKGAYVVKVISASKAGVPDIIFCIKGRFFAIEVKIGKNKPSALQEANIESIRNAEGTAVVVRSLDEVVELLRNY